MFRKTLAINRLLFTFVSVLLVGLLPVFNHMLMPIPHTHIDRNLVSAAADSPADATPENHDHHASSASCCNACCPCCIFTLDQCISAVPCGDNDKVVQLDPVIQSVYIASVTQPPKI